MATFRPPQPTRFRNAKDGISNDDLATVGQTNVAITDAIGRTVRVWTAGQNYAAGSILATLDTEDQINFIRVVNAVTNAPAGGTPAFAALRTAGDIVLAEIEELGIFRRIQFDASNNLTRDYEAGQLAYRQVSQTETRLYIADLAANTGALWTDHFTEITAGNILDGSVSKSKFDAALTTEFDGKLTATFPAANTDASTTEAVRGDDTRLTNERVPVDASVTEAKLAADVEAKLNNTGHANIQELLDGLQRSEFEITNFSSPTTIRFDQLDQNRFQLDFNNQVAFVIEDANVADPQVGSLWSYYVNTPTTASATPNGVIRIIRVFDLSSGARSVTAEPLTFSHDGTTINTLNDLDTRDSNNEGFISGSELPGTAFYLGTAGRTSGHVNVAANGAVSLDGNTARITTGTGAPNSTVSATDFDFYVDTTAAVNNTTSGVTYNYGNFALYYSDGTDWHQADLRVDYETDTLTLSDTNRGQNPLGTAIRFLQDDTTDEITGMWVWDTQNPGAHQWREFRLASTLNELTDVTITSPTGSQVLGYDEDNNRWINVTPRGGIDAFQTTAGYSQGEVFYTAEETTVPTRFHNQVWRVENATQAISTIADFSSRVNNGDIISISASNNRLDAFLSDRITGVGTNVAVTGTISRTNGSPDTTVNVSAGVFDPAIVVGDFVRFSGAGAWYRVVSVPSATQFLVANRGDTIGTITTISKADQIIGITGGAGGSSNVRVDPNNANQLLFDDADGNAQTFSPTIFTVANAQSAVNLGFANDELTFNNSAGTATTVPILSEAQVRALIHTESDFIRLIQIRETDGTNIADASALQSFFTDSARPSRTLRYEKSGASQGITAASLQVVTTSRSSPTTDTFYDFTQAQLDVLNDGDPEIVSFNFQLTAARVTTLAAIFGSTDLADTDEIQLLYNVPDSSPLGFTQHRQSIQVGTIVGNGGPIRFGATASTGGGTPDDNSVGVPQLNFEANTDESQGRFLSIGADSRLTTAASPGVGSGTVGYTELNKGAAVPTQIPTAAGRQEVWVPVFQGDGTTARGVQEAFGAIDLDGDGLRVDADGELHVHVDTASGLRFSGNEGDNDRHIQINPGAGLAAVGDALIGVGVATVTSDALGIITVTTRAADGTTADTTVDTDHIRIRSEDTAGWGTGARPQASFGADGQLAINDSDTSNVSTFIKRSGAWENVIFQTATSSLDRLTTTGSNAIFTVTSDTSGAEMTFEPNGNGTLTLRGSSGTLDIKEIRQIHSGTETADAARFDFSAKVALFLGTPSTPVTGHTVGTFTDLTYTPYTTASNTWYYFPGLRDDDGTITNSNAKGALGLWSNNTNPTATGAQFFNLIG